MRGLLAALRAAFGTPLADAAAEPQPAAPRVTRARHRAESSEDVARRADDYAPAGRHRAAAPA
ncbi:hypothetical protein [Georgenia ruanii]|uniref:hypothetical protein n=1 Tax=Georgenia ruanii TaxID=348442 RepID=UPI001265386A|nr:hypothetical protein [Georgenia ruanii]